MELFFQTKTQSTDAHTVIKDTSMCHKIFIIFSHLDCDSRRTLFNNAYLNPCESIIKSIKVYLYCYQPFLTEKAETVLSGSLMDVNSLQLKVENTYIKYNNISDTAY